MPDEDWDDGDVLDESSTKLSQLSAGRSSSTSSTSANGWHHLCTVGDAKIDPLEELGIRPAVPLPTFGWGTIPDQYDRRWSEDDGEGPIPSDPKRGDLPSFFGWWEGAAMYRD